MEMADMELSEEDRQYVKLFDNQLGLIRDRVTAVAKGYQNGFYLAGRPGTGKTHEVKKQLDALKTVYTLRNSRMTSLGLYTHLREHPEGPTVLDDISTLWYERAAQQILLAAMNGEPGEPRLLTYTTAEVDGRVSFTYYGSIIGISNLPLRRDPIADALQSRTTVLEHNPTDEMIAAVARSRFLNGYEDLSAAEAMKVVEFTIEASKTNEYRLDLRTVNKALNDFMLDRDGHSTRPWQELVLSSMKMTTSSGAFPASRAAKRCYLAGIAADLNKKYPDPAEKKGRDEEWHKLTSLSPDMFYRYSKAGLNP